MGIVTYIQKEVIIYASLPKLDLANGSFLKSTSIVVQLAKMDKQRNL